MENGYPVQPEGRRNFKRRNFPSWFWFSLPGLALVLLAMGILWHWHITVGVRSAQAEDDAGQGVQLAADRQPKGMVLDRRQGKPATSPGADPLTRLLDPSQPDPLPDQGPGPGATPGNSARGTDGAAGAAPAAGDGKTTAPQGAGIFPPPLTRVEVVHGVPGAGKKVALTFDDGPYPTWTMAYLNVLKAYHVPATFFVVGRRVQFFPALARAMAADGMEIGSHSLRHADLAKFKTADIRADLAATAAIIHTTTGQQVNLFRPPYGASDGAVLTTAASLGERVVFWNVDPRDWDRRKTVSAQELTGQILAHVQNGSIILLHEGKPLTAAALPSIIKGLQDRGYQMGTVSELLSNK